MRHFRLTLYLAPPAVSINFTTPAPPNKQPTQQPPAHQDDFHTEPRSRAGKGTIISRCSPISHAEEFFSEVVGDWGTLCGVDVRLTRRPNRPMTCVTLSTKRHSTRSERWMMMMMPSSVGQLSVGSWSRPRRHSYRWRSSCSFPTLIRASFSRQVLTITMQTKGRP